MKIKVQSRSDQMEVLQRDAEILKQMSNKVQIQGHCDERGTEEYNLALGDRRARMVREYRNSLGIDAAKLDTISYGESRPFASQHNEIAGVRIVAPTSLSSIKSYGSASGIRHLASELRYTPWHGHR